MEVKGEENFKKKKLYQCQKSTKKSNHMSPQKIPACLRLQGQTPSLPRSLCQASYPSDLKP